jgi:hypothetical protein
VTRLGLSPRPPLLEPVVGEDQEREHGRDGEQKEDAHSSVQSPRVVIALQRRAKESRGDRSRLPRASEEAACNFPRERRVSLIPVRGKEGLATLCETEAGAGLAFSPG